MNRLDAFPRTGLIAVFVLAGILSIAVSGAEDTTSALGRKAKADWMARPAEAVEKTWDETTKTLTIRQTAPKAFLEGPCQPGDERDLGYRIRFRSDVGDATILLRINSGNPSRLFGTLQTDTGQKIVLINPAGIWVGPGDVLDLPEGEVASTLDPVPSPASTIEKVENSDNDESDDSSVIIKGMRLADWDVVSGGGTVIWYEQSRTLILKLDPSVSEVYFDHFLITSGETLEIDAAKSGPVPRLFHRNTGAILGTLRAAGGLTLVSEGVGGIHIGPRANIDVNGTVVYRQAEAGEGNRTARFDDARQTGKTPLAIQSRTNRAIVNWSSWLDDDSTEMTRFIQPTPDSIALFRFPNQPEDFVPPKIDSNGVILFAKPDGSVIRIDEAGYGQRLEPPGWSDEPPETPNGAPTLAE